MGLVDDLRAGLEGVGQLVDGGRKVANAAVAVADRVDVALEHVTNDKTVARVAQAALGAGIEAAGHENPDGSLEAPANPAPTRGSDPAAGASEAGAGVPGDRLLAPRQPGVGRLAQDHRVRRRRGMRAGLPDRQRERPPLRARDLRLRGEASPAGGTGREAVQRGADLLHLLRRDRRGVGESHPRTREAGLMFQREDDLAEGAPSTAQEGDGVMGEKAPEPAATSGDPQAESPGPSPAPTSAARVTIDPLAAIDPLAPLVLGDVEGELAKLPPEARAETEILDLYQLSGVYEASTVVGNTRDVYAQRWGIFLQWCSVRRLRPLPAHPEVLRLHLLDLAIQQKAMSTLEVTHSAILAAHRIAGLPSPASDRLRAAVTALRRALAERCRRGPIRLEDAAGHRGGLYGRPPGRARPGDDSLDVLGAAPAVGDGGAGLPRRAPGRPAPRPTRTRDPGRPVSGAPRRGGALPGARGGCVAPPAREVRAPAAHRLHRAALCRGPPRTKEGALPGEADPGLRARQDPEAPAQDGGDRTGLVQPARSSRGAAHRSGSARPLAGSSALRTAAVARLKDLTLRCAQRCIHGSQREVRPASRQPRRARASAAGRDGGAGASVRWRRLKRPAARSPAWRGA